MQMFSIWFAVLIQLTAYTLHLLTILDFCMVCAIILISVAWVWEIAISVLNEPLYLTYYILINNEWYSWFHFSLCSDQLICFFCVHFCRLLPRPTICCQICSSQTLVRGKPMLMLPIVKIWILRCRKTWSMTNLTFLR